MDRQTYLHTRQYVVTDRQTSDTETVVIDRGEKQEVNE